MTFRKYSPPFFFWVVAGAILTSYYGPLATLNPFRHLVAMAQALQYLVHLFLGTQPLHRLFPIASEQSLNVLAGLFGLGGWLTLVIVILLREGAADL